jgi:hypothetical protein
MYSSDNTTDKVAINAGVMDGKAGNTCMNLFVHRICNITVVFTQVIWQKNGCWAPIGAGLYNFMTRNDIILCTMCSRN